MLPLEIAELPLDDGPELDEEPDEPEEVDPEELEELGLSEPRGELLVELDPVLL